MDKRPMGKGQRTQKGRKFNKRSEDKVGDFNREKKTCYNDPGWYIREGQLAKDVASFSFNTALGVAPEIEADHNIGQNIIGKNVHIPGIMRIHTVPSVGYAVSGSDPINIAAKNLYSWVRHANSGHSNYDSPDLMLYLVAMDSIYALIWHFQRAYGTARVYSQKNRYIGDALLRSMGFIPDELRMNLSDFRSFINMLIVKASAFCTPTTMTLFARHTWMYSGIYKDEDVEKSQMYLYVPTILYKYVENTGAGKCVPVPILVDTVGGSTGEFVTQTNTLNFWYTTANSMISALTGSEDINIMSGDIRKAYGEGNLWTINLIPEDYSVVPVYSEEVLDQIHNTIFTGDRPRHVLDYTDPSQVQGYSLTNFEIWQDTADPEQPIKCSPQFLNSMSASVEHFLDMAENEPTPERVLVATRNMIHCKAEYTSVGDAWICNFDSFASDLCLFADSYYFNNAGSLVDDRMYGSQYLYLNAEAFTKYHKAPLAYKFIFSASDHSMTLEEVIGELGNFIVLDKTDIDKMHQSALLSMLGVPV